VGLEGDQREASVAGARQRLSRKPKVLLTNLTARHDSLPRKKTSKRVNHDTEPQACAFRAQVSGYSRLKAKKADRLSRSASALSGFRVLSCRAR
jgi:hypothetical protein